MSAPTPSPDPFTIVSLVVGIASLLITIGVAWFTIWLSLYFKREADGVNRQTLELLVDVRTDAKSIVNLTAGELKQYGDMSRRVITSQVSAKASLASSDSEDPVSFTASAPAHETARTSDASDEV